MIRFFSEDVPFRPQHIRSTRSWLGQVIEAHRRTIGEISFIFCSDLHLLGINTRFLQHDYYTDVITFDYCEEKLISGDIFISVDRVRDNAKKHGIPASEEFRRVMLHGCLHLLGYADKSPAETSRMRVAEEKWLRTFTR
jgi:probable rRNA maturation factor